MINWVRKYWWVVMLFLIAFPFILNLIVTCSTPFDLDIAGEPKDWLMFWGAYISSIASFIMVYFTYCIIKQNDDLRSAELFFRIIEDANYWYIEITNIGNGIAEDISIKVEEDFISRICNESRKAFELLLKKKYNLKHDEIELLLIGQSFNRNTKGIFSKNEPTEYIYTEEEFNNLKNTPFVVDVEFKTAGKIKKNRIELKISNYKKYDGRKE